MEFCKNCGSKVKNDHSFCTSCGHPVTQESESNTENKALAENKTIKPQPQQSRRLNQSSTPKQAKPKKKMSIKTKVLFVLVLLLVVAGFGGHKVLEHRYSPESIAETFDKAVANEDAELAKSVMQFTAFPNDLSDETIQTYLSFLKGLEIDYASDLTKAYHAAQNTITSQRVLIENSGNELIELIQSGKKFGLYDDYRIKAIPFEVEMEADLKGAAVTLQGETHTLTEPVTLKHILPGAYTIKGSYEGEYTDLSKEMELDFLEAKQNVLAVFLDFDDHHVKVRSNERDSTLFINGEETGAIGGGFELGPVATDGSLVVHAEFDDEKTEEVAITDEKTIHLNFAEKESADRSGSNNGSNNEDVARDNVAKYPALVDFMEVYATTSVTAMNLGDFSIVEPMLHPEGKAYPESRDYINYVYEEGITEDVISVSVENIEVDGDDFIVDTIEVYDIHYADDSTQRKTFESRYTVSRISDEYYQVWELIWTNEQ
ncbi:zinc ribbon domain-containing protein [Oceanobacillus halotolerans]|uniref:zinc ribbon domain-containing protein n=1 Tax=Oceanobacillus halotolerans TaxID=2663380 RepID=UPI0013DAEDA8|nr:zinc-ribbon domain-containing protein [Oceanobacillus halotolerans]